MILIGLISIFCSAQSQIYKWTDSSGHVHFSDEPRPGAKSVDLPPPQTFSSPPIQKKQRPLPMKKIKTNNQSIIKFRLYNLSPKQQLGIIKDMSLSLYKQNPSSRVVTSFRSCMMDSPLVNPQHRLLLP